MCDFIDLNKASPKDFYPLPSIDSLVDNVSFVEFSRCILRVQSDLYAPEGRE